MTLLLGPTVEENPREPEPFLELEEETEGAPASSESASAKGGFWERTRDTGWGKERSAMSTAVGPGLSQPGPHI